MRFYVSFLIVVLMNAAAFAQGPNLRYRFDENGSGNPVNEGTLNPGASVMIGHSTNGVGADGTSCLRGSGTSGARVFTSLYMNQGNSPWTCLLYTSPSPRDRQKSRMPSSA